MKKALTLVELVVSIGIIVFFITALGPSFRNIGKDRQLELIAEEVKDGIILARTNIVAPDRDKTGAALEKFEFQLIDEHSYRVLDGAGQEVLKKTLPGDLIFISSLPFPQTIEFKFEKQGEPTSSAEFQIKNTSRNKSRTISVLTSGTAEVK